jgi:hypothetical protein
VSGRGQRGRRRPPSNSEDPHMEEKELEKFLDAIEKF